MPYRKNIVRDRSLEWFAAFVMICWGFALALPGDTLARPAFRAFTIFLRFGMTETLWAVVFMSFGIARVLALYINGRSPRSPFARIIGAAFGAVSWAQIAWLFAMQGYLVTGVASTATPIYVLLTITEIISVWRAAHDARYYSPRKHRTRNADSSDTGGVAGKRLRRETRETGAAAAVA